VGLLAHLHPPWAKEFGKVLEKKERKREKGKESTGQTPGPGPAGVGTSALHATTNSNQWEGKKTKR